MKRSMRRVWSVLLVCMLLFVPAMESAAAVYDLASGTFPETLFPGEGLSGISPGTLTVDGTAAETPEDTWTNNEKGRVYSVTKDDAGNYSLTTLGYTLTVKGGSSSGKENGGTEIHKAFSPEENPDEAAAGADTACYSAGDQVVIKAADPAEGMQFSGWTVESPESGFSIDDPSLAETTLTMPDNAEGVVIAAQYEEIPAGPVETPPEGNQAGTEGTPPAENQIESEGTPSAENQTGAEGAPLTANQTESEGTPSAENLNGSGDIQIGSAETQSMYTLTVNNGSDSGEYEYAAGTPVEVTADDRSAEGLAFAGWSTDSWNLALADPSQAVISFTMPEEPVTLTANYTETAQPETYPVSVEYGTGAGEYEPGTRVVITAQDRSGEGLVFNGWAVTSLNAELENIGASETAFVMPAAAVTISAGYTAAGVQQIEETQLGQETPAETNQTESETSAETNQTESETNQTESENATEAPSEEQVYKLTVENGEGSGEYAAGAIVSIEAKERDGMVFAGWVSYNDKVVISNPAAQVTTLAMPAEDVTIAADYVTAQYKITLDFGDGNPIVSTHVPGEIVTVSAPDRGAEMLQFSGWSGTQVIAGTAVALQFADPAAAVTTFTMPNGEVTISASYTPVPSTYHVTVSNGLINGEYKELDCVKGDTITISADAGPKGQKFSQWEVNGGKTDLGKKTYKKNIKITVKKDMDFLAVYEGIEYKVTVNSGTGDYRKCTQGTTVTLKADKAQEGMEFDHWEVDEGKAVLDDTSKSRTTFVMPAGNVEVSAYYRRIQYQLAVENGTSDSQYYYMGDTVTVSSSYPASGRVFNGWTSDGADVKFADSGRYQTTFTMPASNVVARATYADGPSVDSNLILNVEQGGQYYTGDSIEFTASGAGMENTSPNPGDYRYRPASYQIGNVTGTWQGAPYSTSMAINAAGEYTLKVIYNKDVYNGSEWKTDGTVDTKSVTFRVDSGRTSVETGDETPIELVVGVLVASGLVFIVLLLLFLKKRRR